MFWVEFGVFSFPFFFRNSRLLFSRPSRFVPQQNETFFRKRLLFAWSSCFWSLKNICTYHAVSSKVISLFSSFWILHEAVTLLFKMHPIPLQTFSQRNFQPLGSAHRPPTGFRIANLRYETLFLLQNQEIPTEISSIYRFPDLYQKVRPDEAGDQF